MPDSFPDPLEHDFPEWLPFGDYLYFGPDVIAFGDELTIENLIEAYSKGIFPWHMEGLPLPWYCPRRRAVLVFDELKIPRSLEKERRKNRLSFTIDQAFEQVIKECSAMKRPGQKGTWITEEFAESYTEIHRLGHAHSVEAWDDRGKLVGGIYGVDAGGAFCGESMFYIKPDASKLALLFLIDHLRSRGSTWLDIQVMTPHMQALGAIDIDRVEFLNKLSEARSKGLKLF